MHRSLLHCYVRLASLVIFTLSLLVWPVAAAQATGVSPGIIELNDLANGLKIEKSIQVSRGDDTGVAVFQVTAAGEGARYLELPTASITIPHGERSGIFSFFIHPQNAPNGTLEATLTFIKGVTTETQAGVAGTITTALSVQEGAVAKIKFSITDKQIKQFLIVKAQTEQTEVGQKAILNFIFRNEGNVDAKPDKIVLSISEETDPSRVIIIELKAEDLPFVSPSKEQEFVIPLPQEIPQGKYFMKAEFYRGDDIIFTQDKMRLVVHPAGTLAQKLSTVSFTTNQVVALPGELIKLDAVVKNIGSVITKVIWFTEVKKDGKTLDLLRSDEKLVPMNQEAKFTLTFRPPAKGTHNFDGYASYGISETERHTITVTVGQNNLLSGSVWYSVGGIVVVLSLAGLGLLLWRQKKLSHRKKITKYFAKRSGARRPVHKK